MIQIKMYKKPMAIDKKMKLSIFTSAKIGMASRGGTKLIKERLKKQGRSSCKIIYIPSFPKTEITRI
ncbi:hypothetical protein OIU84_014223 [Salix udensis]|uniref:Uncharacterized protein n=1 Tax=Salix udensis TaxID=889485 RepID=A0AAD6NRS2_9ROSI|nr:hypothetical protein OIU84_014223 [Salix udensis]